MSLVHRASFALALSICALGAAGCSSELEDDDVASSEDALGANTSVSPVALSFQDVNRASIRVTFEKRSGDAASWQGGFTLVGSDGFTKEGTCSAPAIPARWSHGYANCTAYFDGSATGTIAFRYSGSGLTRLSMTSN